MLRFGKLLIRKVPRERGVLTRDRVSTDLSSLTTGNSDIWALAASVSSPLFTGGRLTKQRRAAKAVFDQAKFQYSQSALRAFQEVSDALIAAEKLGALEEQQKRQVTALTESVAIANRRYRGGLRPRRHPSGVPQSARF